MGVRPFFCCAGVSLRFFRHVDPILAPFWLHLGASWSHLGSIWDVFGVILGHLGAIFCPIGWADGVTQAKRFLELFILVAGHGSKFLEPFWCQVASLGPLGRGFLPYWLGLSCSIETIFDEFHAELEAMEESLFI